MKKKVIFFLITIIIIGICFISYKKFIIHSKKINNISEIETISNDNNFEQNSSKKNEVNEENEEDLKEKNSVKEIETNDKISENRTTNKSNVTAVKKQNEVSPSGFMGSSLYKVVLYSNGEVYAETFDGNGFTDENIISNELIARKAKSIKQSSEEETYGMVIVDADEIIKNDIGWIAFK